MDDVLAKHELRSTGDIIGQALEDSAGYPLVAKWDPKQNRFVIWFCEIQLSFGNFAFGMEQFAQVLTPDVRRRLLARVEDEGLTEPEKRQHSVAGGLDEKKKS